jgi:hypothetical protein
VVVLEIMVMDMVDMVSDPISQWDLVTDPISQGDWDILDRNTNECCEHQTNNLHICHMFQ